MPGPFSIQNKAAIVVVDDGPVELPRFVHGDAFIPHVGKHFFRVTASRIPPTATAAAAHADNIPGAQPAHVCAPITEYFLPVSTRIDHHPGRPTGATLIGAFGNGFPGVLMCREQGNAIL